MLYCTVSEKDYAHYTYFEEDNAEREHLLPNVELVLCDADVFHEVVRNGIGDVAAIELCTMDN
jgi:hypothetical protein